jgi:drug/metabolite transporter (DMT)-like permease
VLTLILPGGGRARALRRCPAATWRPAVCAGLAEAVALLALARGGQDSQLAVTAAVSNLYPVIPLAAGVLWFREQLTARQVLGAGIITAGLVLLGIA